MVVSVFKPRCGGKGGGVFERGCMLNRGKSIYICIIWVSSFDPTSRIKEGNLSNDDGNSNTTKQDITDMMDKNNSYVKAWHILIHFFAVQ